MKNKSIKAIALICTMIICSCTKVDDNTIKIACNLPLTGFLSTYGESVRDGVNFANTMFLNDSMLANNINIHYDFQDNKSSSKEAVNIFAKHKISNIDIYMSGITDQTFSIIDQVDKMKIPHFLWAFTPLFLSERNSGYNFRPWLNLGMEAQNYIKYIDNLDKKPKTVSLLYLNVGGVQMQFNNYIKPELEKRNIKVIVNQAYDPAQKDYKGEILKMKSANADFMIINGYKGNLISIIKDLKGQNMITKNNNIFSFDLMDAQEDLSKEMLCDLCVPVPMFEITKLTTNKAWCEKFKQIYNREPRYTDAYAYDCAYAIYIAAKMSRKNNYSLEANLKNIEFNSITGEFKLDAYGDILTPIRICRYDNSGVKSFID